MTICMNFPDHAPCKRVTYSLQKTKYHFTEGITRRPTVTICKKLTIPDQALYKRVTSSLQKRKHHITEGLYRKHYKKANHDHMYMQESSRSCTL